jgi:hypothetical protein
MSETAQEFADRKAREERELERKRAESQEQHQKNETVQNAIKAELPTLFDRIHDQLVKDGEVYGKMQPPLVIPISRPEPMMIILRHHGVDVQTIQISSEYYAPWQAHTIVMNHLNKPNGLDHLKLTRLGNTTRMEIGNASFSFKDDIARITGHFTKPFRGK